MTETTGKPVIAIRGLGKRFGDNVVLAGIDLDVQPSQVVVVIGPSGSGKSTFLRCCNGLETAETGRVQILGRTLVDEGRMLVERDLNALRQEVGMVFQSFNLFPHLSVLENVSIGPRKLKKLPAAEARDRAMALLDKVGLAQKASAMPASLSGGQKQRVAIARSLAMQPKVMLFDEPTSALDPELVGEVLRVIRSLGDEGRTMLLVTHEIGFAYHFATRVLFLADGLIAEQGPPATLLREPTDPRTRSFLASHHEFHF
jgi:polar amino acid transport system ATP-binding protein